MALAVLCVLGMGVAPAFPQGAEKKNLIENSGFERGGGANDNLWYGTTRDGTIRAQSGSYTALTPDGKIGQLPMPASVSLGDLNGDGLHDLVVGSPNGYINIFFNEGSKSEPKFTTGELTPIFMGPATRFRVPRVHLADPAGAGKLDLWVGTYGGDILRIPNAGSGTAPDFRNPPRLDSLFIPTTRDANRRWGNIFSPAIWDFNKDGKPDLLIGEGSYSANSVHILLNQGSAASPRFDDSNRHVLAYGMGREQLSQAVVDYDGNGFPDLLVSDSSGQIGLYSSTVEPKDAAAKEDNRLTAQAGGKIAQGEKWAPGEHLPFVKYIESGGSPIKFSGLTTIAAGDLTGDGLFDIVVGQANGQVSLIKNTGTATEPKFEKPAVLKGEPTPAVNASTGWSAGTNVANGNFFALASVVSNEDDPNLKAPEGTRALKFFYAKNNNKILKSSFSYAIPDSPGTKPTPRNTFDLSVSNIPLTLGKTYDFSFQTKGSGVSNPKIDLTFQRGIRQTEDQTRREGGRVVTQRGKFLQEKGGLDGVAFTVGSNWNTARNNFSVTFKERELNNPNAGDDKGRLQANLKITFDLAPGSGEIYFDDFQLTER